MRPKFSNLILGFLLPALLAVASAAQSGNAAPGTTPDDQSALLARAVANEVAALADSSHPMRYHLRKVSPRLTTVKAIIETRDGDVARLLSRDNAPLSAEDKQKEEDRLNQLSADASRQGHRQEREASDIDKFTKILRALPTALIYKYSRNEGGQSVYSFVPDPKFQPQNFEEQLLTGMEGELWLDTKAERVTKLSGKLVKDVDYGWGIIGQIDKGAALLIEQKEISPGLWRATRLIIKANYRVVYKSRSSDATLELSDFSPVQQGLDYRTAIQMLKQ
jgi:hypothetical protein